MNLPKHQQGSALFNLISGIVIAIAVLFFLIKLATTGFYSDVAESTESATATRVIPVGVVKIGEALAAGASPAMGNFKKSCAACHGASSSIPFAPKLGNKDNWADRIKQGKEVLFKHAIEGFTNPNGGTMPAKGGSSLSDDEVKAIVVYMANEAGAGFETEGEPAKTDDNASASQPAQAETSDKKAEATAPAKEADNKKSVKEKTNKKKVEKDDSNKKSNDKKKADNKA